jgi:hypothetical protein
MRPFFIPKMCRRLPYGTFPPPTMRKRGPGRFYRAPCGRQERPATDACNAPVANLTTGRCWTPARTRSYSATGSGSRPTGRPSSPVAVSSKSRRTVEVPFSRLLPPAPNASIGKRQPGRFYRACRCRPGSWPDAGVDRLRRYWGLPM